MILNIWCPACEEVVCEQRDHEDAQPMTCQHCDHGWKLALVRSGRKFDDISVDMCCDGECEWDQEDAYVWKWCARQRRP